MGGSTRTLRSGDYVLRVPDGCGPAGVRRSAGEDVTLDVRGGAAPFSVAGEERVRFWWRGETRRDGVELARLAAPSPGARPRRRAERPRAARRGESALPA